MRLLLLALLAALAVGYALGHFHAAERVFDWCYDLAMGAHKPHSVGRAVAEASGCLLLALALLARPRRTWRAIRDASLPVYTGIAWALILIGAGVLAIVKAVA